MAGKGKNANAAFQVEKKNGFTFVIRSLVARRNDRLRNEKRGALFFLTPNTESSAWKLIETPIGDKRGCETTRKRQNGKERRCR